jgi:hypothetical protein
MWRDIFNIFLGVIAVLGFAGLTGPQLFKYAKHALTKRSRIQMVYLVFAVVMTPAFIFIALKSFETLGLAGSLAAIAVIPLIWFETLLDVWRLRLSQRGVKVAIVVRAIVALAMFSLLITSSVLSDGNRPLWQRLAPTLGGFGMGAGILVLNSYVNKKRENKLLSQKDDKDSPL